MCNCLKILLQLSEQDEIRNQLPVFWSTSSTNWTVEFVLEVAQHNGSHEELVQNGSKRKYWPPATDIKTPLTKKFEETQTQAVRDTQNQTPSAFSCELLRLCWIKKSTYQAYIGSSHEGMFFLFVRFLPLLIQHTFSCHWLFPSEIVVIVSVFYMAPRLDPTARILDMTQDRTTQLFKSYNRVSHLCTLMHKNGSCHVWLKVTKS